jgi:RND superfamily putative drug exporter
VAGHDEAKVGGVFDRIGDFVVKWPVLVIGCWIAVAAALVLLLPPLQVQAAKHQQAPLPPDAPVMQLQDEMIKAFEAKADGGGGPAPAASPASSAASLLMVVLVDEKGLTPADEDVYRKLLDNLRADTADKMSVQDFLGTPEMRSLLESKD